MLETAKNTLKNLWFQDTEKPLYINDVAVRVRAGILLIIPVYMAFTLFDVVFGASWEVVENTTIIDTFETDWDERIVYQIEAVKRVFDYTFQTKLLLYALLEMLLGMSVFSARFSPTILLATLLTLGSKPIWKPIAPKRCAWGLGASFILVCIVFFNPDSIAIWLNNWLGSSIPTDSNYVPTWLALNLVWICLLFMWLECVLGFCVGCKIHTGLVKIGFVNHKCEACENIDWDKISDKKRQNLKDKN
ncbi:MAG: DUF4395 domain-containing protein [Candidatus Thioglobus sp.]|nr:DUF4395 domain-containing protein [Candidatus Thioglobus sp.]